MKQLFFCLLLLANVFAFAADSQTSPSTYIHEHPIIPKMVGLAGGTFKMGCVSGEGCRDGERVRALTLSPFRISQYEITIGQYMSCVEAGECKQPVWLDEKGRKKFFLQDLWADNAFDNPNHPIVGVSWTEALHYTRWLRTLTGEHYRLPTDAEWEYAARGGIEMFTASKPYANQDWPLDYSKDPHLWLIGFKVNGGNSAGKDGYYYLAPVGSYPPNNYGLYDMQGNVAEWCWEAVNNLVNNGEYEYDSSHDPVGLSDLSPDMLHVTRGGGWSSNPEDLRIPRRIPVPDIPAEDIGFRVVISHPIEDD
ncbi:MAG: formylglycine-generating enzyme family protein [bacterium]